MSDKNIKKKEELLKNISDTESKAKKLSSKAIELNKKAQFAADLAANQREFISLIPDDSFVPEPHWDNSISSWEKLSVNVGETATALANTPSIEFATDSTSMSGIAIISRSNIDMLPPERRQPARESYSKHMRLFESLSLPQSIGNQLNRLGLSVNKLGRQSVQSLMEQSEAAYSAPSTPDVSPGGVLLPLREAINEAISLLLQKRPQQEKAKNHYEKVRSILFQCKQSFVDDQEIDRFASEASNLNDSLSGAKQAPMDREQVRELLRKSQIFLKHFLEAIDENKLKL